MKIIKTVQLLSNLSLHWYHERTRPVVWFTYNKVTGSKHDSFTSQTQLTVLDSLLSMDTRQRDETLAIYTMIMSAGKEKEALKIIEKVCTEVDIYE
jgi:hypothetical protein